MPHRILLKTTIPTTEDDWHVGRFSMLHEHLAGLTDGAGDPLYVVTARDRAEDTDGNDLDLAAAGRGDYDQLWLFAVDVTGALSSEDCAAIDRFRTRGGGLFMTRDHQDLGSCLTKLGPVGLTQHFQHANPEPDPARQRIDDAITTDISWPNYHSGANGNFQVIAPTEPLHPLMRRANGEPMRYLPSHPHEGTVSAPAVLEGQARAVACGQSKTTGSRFNLLVAVEEAGRGRVVSDASFHHLCDYNWDPARGCPSFVTETPGDGILTNAEAASDARRYVQNAAAWLAGAI